MPLSHVAYDGDGSERGFDIPFPFLSRAHIRVGLGWDYFTNEFDQELATPAGYVWVSNTRIELTTAPAIGAVLSILRATPRNEQLVQWSDASTMQEGDHNTADLQTLYLLQELFDRSYFASFVDDDGLPGIDQAVGLASAALVALKVRNDQRILLGANVSDSEMAVAFADAAANGKLIVFAENTTVKIPSVAPTIQAACTLVVPTVDVTVLIESGHTINNKNVLQNGDYSRFLLTSEDAEVLVGVNLPGDLSGVVECYNAKAPVWDFILDCDGKSGTGLALLSASQGVIKTSKGIKRARRANAFLTQASNLSCQSVGPAGAILSDGLETGVWITWGSSLSSHLLDLRNCGTPNGPGNDGGFGAFISRASHVQLDRANFDGCWNGLRAARCVVSVRQATFTNVGNYGIVQFEEGFVNASRGNFSGSGNANQPILQIGIGLSNRAQGGGVLCAEESTFNDAVGDIAIVHGGNGTINIDNSTGTNLQRRVGTVNNGTLSCIFSSFSAAAGNTVTELFLVSRNGSARVFSGTYDGAGSVRNLGRILANGTGVFDAVTTANFTENAIARTENAGQVYALAATHNGSSNPMNRGANPNGELVRHANGVQECWAWLEVTNIGSTKSMNRTWNFPAAFAEPLSTVVVTAKMSVRNPSNQQISSTRDKLKDAQLLSGAVSTAGTEFFVEINSSASTEFVTGDTCWIRAHAIGRWF